MRKTRKEYSRTYYLKHREEILERQKNYQKKNREKINEYSSLYKKHHRKAATQIAYNWKKQNPWVSHYSDAKRRCENPNTDAYRYYGGRGIKFLMTVTNFKYLWFRDRAYLMEKPSIDREDNDGNYTLTNCQFIEMSKNIAKKNRRK